MSEFIVILIQKASGMDVLQENYSILTLPHPRSGPSVFLYENGKIFELQKVALRKFGCIFMDQKISSSSDVYLATVFDPRFLLLPYLHNSGGKYSPIEQIIPHVDGCSRIPLQNINNWKMSDMCDVNDKLGDDMILYRYNEEKTLAWLRLKVLRTARVIQTKRKLVESSQRKTLVDTFRTAEQSLTVPSPVEESSEGEPNRCDILEALDIISDYVAEAVATKLIGLFSISSEEISNSHAAARAATKRKADWEVELEIENEALKYQSGIATSAPQAKHSISATAAPIQKNKTQKTDKKLTPGNLSTTKSIASFFSKK